MNLFKKFFQFAIGNGIVLILGFVSSPIITRIISPDEMGKFSMFNTVVNLLIVVFLVGIDQAYVRYYYNEEENDRAKLLGKCIIIPLIINIVISIIILIFYKDISKYISNEKSLFLAILIVIQLIFSVFSRFALLEVRMKQRAKLYSILNIVMKITYLILVMSLFYLGNNTYINLVIATVISNIIMGALAILLEKKEWENAFRISKINTSIKELIKYGAPFIFSSAIMWIFQSIDKIVIKELCGYTEVGLYSGAMNIISLLNTFQAAFTTFWVPVAYERYSKNPNDKEFFTKINKIVSFVMIFIAISLISGKDIIILLLGEKYRQAMFIFPYLVFMPIMYTISETTVLGINFMKKTNSHIYISIISAIFNACGNLILVPRFGAIGAAISTGLAYIVFFVMRTYISYKYYKVNYNCGKFTISIILTYTLAAYSSFNKFNSTILILTITIVVIILVLYKDLLSESMFFYKKIKIDYLNKKR